MTKADETEKLIGGLQHCADYLDRLHIIRIMAAIGIPVALVAFGIDLYFRVLERGVVAEERVAREEARIGLAWQLLAAKTTGNAGKGWAMSFLTSRKQSLEAIDLQGTCDVNSDPLVIIQDAFAPKAIVRDSNFACVKFETSVLTGADFSSSNLSNAAFDFSDLAGANFQISNLTGVRFSAANLEGAEFGSANLHGAGFVGANISGSDFQNAFGFPKSLRFAWAWTDRLPIGLPESTSYMVCPIGDRPKYEEMMAHLKAGDGFHKTDGWGTTELFAKTIEWISEGTRQVLTLPFKDCK